MFRYYYSNGSTKDLFAKTGGSCDNGGG